MLASDILAVAAISCLVVALHHAVNPEYQFSALLEILPFLTMLLPFFLIQGLYPGLLLHPADEIRRIFYSVSVIFLTWAAISFLMRAELGYSRAVFLILWVSGPPVILLFRQMARRCFRTKKWWGVPAVILGHGPTTGRIARTLNEGMFGLKVIGIFTDHQTLVGDQDMPLVLGDLRAAAPLGHAGIAQYAIVVLPDGTNRELHCSFQEHCKGFSHVLLVPDMPGVCSLGISVRQIGGELGFELQRRLSHKHSAIAKRALDLVASAALLLLMAPLLVAMAALIKFTSKGPVVFRHLRCGQANTTFEVFKFRSMFTDANTILEKHLSFHPESRTEWQRDHKLKNDPRVTLVGRFLRRYSLDELPQLLNVLLGHMSLVGPRPILSNEIVKYGRDYSLYTKVRPGMTGLWQVSGRNNTTYEERVLFDRYYINNRSAWLDIYLLVRTVGAVIRGDGAC